MNDSYPPKHLDIPAAWYGRDLAADESKWIVELSPSDVQELELAAEHFLDKTANIAQLDQSSFPLPTLAIKLKTLRQQLVSGLGFSLWRGLPVHRYPIDVTATIFFGLGVHLGRARSQNARGHLLGHVRDMGKDINDANVRIYQTTHRQTFHTDSTDVVGLMCLKPAKEGGDSLLASSVSVYNEMSASHPELVEWLFEPVATDRRGEVPEGQKPWFEIPVLNWHQGFLTCLYHRMYIQSAERFDAAPALHPQHKAALDVFDALTNDTDLHLRMRLEPGDIQFVYNHHMLHDRTHFSDSSDVSQRRHMLRLWLAIPGDRPLPTVFRQRYGAIDVGNRGGIVTAGTSPHVPLTP
ncbi:MAG: TauD/TfdA family dioxygenase [Granulosicoccus sp.]|nr:TauD/TfdA family dioxygenase [Granulosicoccus sp.]